MADPRLDVAYDEIKAKYSSWKIDAATITYSAASAGGSAQVGLAVTTTSTAETIALVGNNEFVLGKLIKVEADGIATVQHKGVMTLPGGTSASLTRGKAIMGDLLVAAKGYIQEVATQYTVMNGKIWDPATTTAVVVKL